MPVSSAILHEAQVLARVGLRVTAHDLDTSFALSPRDAVAKIPGLREGTAAVPRGR